MDDYFTIQTQDHYKTLFVELHTLQKQGVACDVILVAEDGEILAHKVILMAVSKYFKRQLVSTLRQETPKVVLRGISVMELANIVKYIYSGKLLVASDSMGITLKVCEMLELDDIVKGYKDCNIEQSCSEANLIHTDVPKLTETNIKGMSNVLSSFKDALAQASIENVRQTLKHKSGETTVLRFTLPDCGNDSVSGDSQSSAPDKASDSSIVPQAGKQLSALNTSGDTTNKTRGRIISANANSLSSRTSLPAPKPKIVSLYSDTPVSKSKQTAMPRAGVPGITEKVTDTYSIGRLRIGQPSTVNSYFVTKRLQQSTQQSPVPETSCRNTANPKSTNMTTPGKDQKLTQESLATTTDINPLTSVAEQTNELMPSKLSAGKSAVIELNTDTTKERFILPQQLKEDARERLTKLIGKAKSFSEDEKQDSGQALSSDTDEVIYIKKETGDDSFTDTESYKASEVNAKNKRFGSAAAVGDHSDSEQLAIPCITWCDKKDAKGESISPEPYGVIKDKFKVTPLRESDNEMSEHFQDERDVPAKANYSQSKLVVKLNRLTQREMSKWSKISGSGTVKKNIKKYSIIRTGETEANEPPEKRKKENASGTTPSLDRGMEEFRCDVCNVKFETFPELNQHSIVHSAVDLRTSSELEICTNCNARFETKQLLLEHSKEHESNAVLTCECGNLLYRGPGCKTNLGSSMICPVCKKSVSGRTEQLASWNNDTVKRYECRVCSFTTVKGYEYYFHMKEHHGTKPVYKCPSEGCSFSTHLRTKLNLHQARTGVHQSYKCVYYGRRPGRPAVNYMGPRAVDMERHETKRVFEVGKLLPGDYIIPDIKVLNIKGHIPLETTNMKGN